MPAESIPPEMTVCADTPSVDSARLQMIRDLSKESDPGLVPEMLKCWKSESARRFEQARAGLAAQDLEEIKAAAHALKGSCANLGVTRLSEMGRVLECEVESLPAAGDLLALMETEFHHVRQTLAAAHASA